MIFLRVEDAVPVPPAAPVLLEAVTPPVAVSSVPNEDVPAAAPTVIVGSNCPGITSTTPYAKPPPPPPPPKLALADPPPPKTATPIWKTLLGTTNEEVVVVIN
jgi:hypothetical protein